MMRIFLFLFVLGFCGTSFVQAGLPMVTEKAVIQAADGSYSVQGKDDGDDVPILDPHQITALTDQKLVDACTDVIVEIEASKTFHSTSGFSPKEYKKYKALLKYRIHLSLEIQRRKLDMPVLSY
ncbi:MAG: hypothetical protein V2A70_08615 [Candidatus Omnitrophota bacterium]